MWSRAIPGSRSHSFRADLRSQFIISWTMKTTAAATDSPERPSYQYGRPSAAAARSAALAAPSAPEVPAGAVRSSQPFRRYGVGDRVLICNHAARWSNLVNRHGFPDGHGDSVEERRGPYIYAMATVMRIHFGENQQYYTVSRADSGGEQRADAGELGVCVGFFVCILVLHSVVLRWCTMHAVVVVSCSRRNV